MINKKVNLNDIVYTVTQFDESLFLSIKKRGIAIPVKVQQVDDKYICVDGNKRLSVCKVLSEEDDKFINVPVMITNDFSKAGSSYWGNTLNHH